MAVGKAADSNRNSFFKGNDDEQWFLKRHGHRSEADGNWDGRQTAGDEYATDSGSASASQRYAANATRLLLAGLCYIGVRLITAYYILGTRKFGAKEESHAEMISATCSGQPVFSYYFDANTGEWKQGFTLIPWTPMPDGQWSSQRW